MTRNKSLIIWDSVGLSRACKPIVRYTKKRETREEQSEDSGKSRLKVVCKIELVRACVESASIDHSLCSYNFLLNLNSLCILTHSAPRVCIAARNGETCVCG